MIRVDRVHPFGINIRFTRDEFYQTVWDSQRDRAYGTGCIVTAFYDVPQLMSHFTKYCKLQSHLVGPSHVHIQEEEYARFDYLKFVLILRGRDVCIVCPYFLCEVKVLVSLRLVHTYVLIHKYQKM